MLGDPAAFVETLMAQAEPAPFGDGTKTRVDPTVRKAFRAQARGNVDVIGFEPQQAGIIEEVERALSPRERLSASLTDVLVYPPGGKFARHVDTPRDPDVVGTLVVQLPVAYQGGAMWISDGFESRLIDWGDPRGEIFWCAFHGDVEHEIRAVQTGHRVTLTYALLQAGVARQPESDRTAEVGAALEAALGDPQFLPEGGALVVPCARRVTLPKEHEGHVDSRRLRGADRDVAELLRDLQLPFIVRPCLAFLDVQHRDKPAVAWAAPYVARLDRKLAEHEVATLGEVITLAKQAHDDDGAIDCVSLARAAAGNGECVSFADRVRLDDGAATQWVWRQKAHATRIHEATFSFEGYFGNEHFDAYVYEFVAFEVTIGDLHRRGIAPAPVAEHRVTHVKFGTGTVVSERGEGEQKTFEVRFEDGTTRRLLAKFVEST